MKRVFRRINGRLLFVLVVVAASVALSSLGPLRWRWRSDIAHSDGVHAAEKKLVVRPLHTWPDQFHPTVGSGQSYGAQAEPFCEQQPWLCTDSEVPYEGRYIGHDEPSLLFYSTIPGSGNSNQYTLILPKDPPTLPKQDGTGGTFNFQLHPTFWFGMAMCDTQSAPEFTQTCVPDTDANIFDNPDPIAPDYIGNHPGTAFMEMQFYPPGWVGQCGDATHWCAALTIDSLNFDQNNGITNNQDCLNKVSQEPINFAFITKSGSADSAADPLNPRAPPNPATDLFMNSGGQADSYVAGYGQRLPSNYQRRNDRPNGLDDRQYVQRLRSGDL